MISVVRNEDLPAGWREDSERAVQFAGRQTGSDSREIRLTENGIGISSGRFGGGSAEKKQPVISLVDNPEIASRGHAETGRIEEAVTITSRIVSREKGLSENSVGNSSVALVGGVVKAQDAMVSRVRDPEASAAVDGEAFGIADTAIDRRGDGIREIDLPENPVGRCAVGFPRRIAEPQDSTAVAYLEGTGRVDRDVVRTRHRVVGIGRKGIRIEISLSQHPVCVCTIGIGLDNRIVESENAVISGVYHPETPVRLDRQTERCPHGGAGDSEVVLCEIRLTKNADGRVPVHEALQRFKPQYPVVGAIADEDIRSRGVDNHVFRIPNLRCGRSCECSVKVSLAQDQVGALAVRPSRFQWRAKKETTGNEKGNGKGSFHLCTLFEAKGICARGLEKPARLLPAVP